MQDVLLTFLNGERSGVKEISVRLSDGRADLAGPGLPTLRRVLDDRGGGMAQQTFHLEFDNTRLRECSVILGGSAEPLAIAFVGQELIDDY